MKVARRGAARGWEWAGGGCHRNALGAKREKWEDLEDTLRDCDS